MARDQLTAMRAWHWRSPPTSPCHLPGLHEAVRNLYLPSFLLLSGSVSHCWLRGPSLLSIGVKQATGPGHQPPKTPEFLNQPTSNIIYWLLERAFRDTNRNRHVQKKRKFVLYVVLSASIHLNFTSPMSYNFSDKEYLFLLPLYDSNWKNKEPQQSLKWKGPDLQNGIHWSRK